MYYEDEDLDIPLTLEEQEENDVNSLGESVEEEVEEVEEVEEEEEIEEDASIDYTEDPDSSNLDLDV